MHLAAPCPATACTINEAARNAERFRAAGWINHAPDKVHGKRDRFWVSIKLLGFHGAYLDEGVQQFLTAYSESELCEVAEEPYERARAKRLAR